MESHWQTVRENLKARLAPTAFQLWIEPMQAHLGEEGELYLDCPNSFFIHWIQANYLPEIAAEYLKIQGKVPPIKLRLAPAAAKTKLTAVVNQPRLPDLEGKKFFGRQLNQQYTFERFVVGSSNRLAFQASQALAGNDTVFGRTLFLASQTGLGKSHLSQAVGNYMCVNASGARILYLTAEDFANEMVAALRAGKMAQFKEKFRRQCDALLLEGVHFLSGKEKIQTELCYTLDCLADQKKKIVLTSSYLPTEIPQLNQELVSRFTGGVITPIEPPDFATRVQILERRVKERQARVPQPVVEYLATYLTQDIRQMLSALDNLLLKSAALGLPPDLKLAAEVLQDFQAAQVRLREEDIQRLICDNYRLQREELLGRSRRKQVVKARNLAIYLCRQYLQRSLPELGRAFRRSHSTILHALESVERERQVSAAVAQELAYLEQCLQKSPSWRRLSRPPLAESPGD